MSGPPRIPGPEGVPSSDFQAAYDSGAPAWCTGRVQSVVLDVLDRGWLPRGPVLDAGCGTGENLVAIAQRRPGLQLSGVDLVPGAIEQAVNRVAEAGLADRVHVTAGDLRDSVEGGPFESILDAGVLHVFSDDDRPRYLRRLHEVLVPDGELVVIVFSDAESSPGGPRRFARKELSDCIERGGFRVTDLESCRYETVRHDDGARAWLARAIRG